MTFAAWPIQTNTEKNKFPTLEKSVPKLAIVATIIVLITILSGSFAVWNEAGSVCPKWPLCGGNFIPESSLVWINVSHRIVAMVAVIFTTWVAVRTLLLPFSNILVRRAAAGVLAISLIQVFAGAAIPLTGFSDWTRAVHLSLATLLWAAMALMTMLIWTRFWVQVKTITR